MAEHRYPERTVASPQDSLTVGLRIPHELTGGAAGLRDYAVRAEAAGMDRLFTGDHVTFRGGQGFDGLLTATALAVAAPRLTVQTAVYLLPLRHPVPVARQVATLAGLARRSRWTATSFAWTGSGSCPRRSRPCRS